MELLNDYRRRYEASRPRHPVLLEAARDHRLVTADLVQWAISGIEMPRNGDSEQPDGHFSLLILQQRVTPEVLQRAYALLRNDQPAARQLGVSILREHPGLDHAPYPHSLKTIEKLERMLEDETELQVLVLGLAAVGWQRHPAGCAVLLRYRRHEEGLVRGAVAGNLIICCANGVPLARDSVAAMLEFTRDPDPDIRGAVFWDIAEYPEVFLDWREEFLMAAERGASDVDQDVRATATRAVQSLLGSVESP